MRTCTPGSSLLALVQVNACNTLSGSKRKGGGNMWVMSEVKDNYVCYSFFAEWGCFTWVSVFFLLWFYSSYSYWKKRMCEHTNTSFKRQFLELLYVHGNIGRKVLTLPTWPFAPRGSWPPPSPASLARVMRTFATVGEPTPRSHSHPQSRVFMRIHFCCCTFHGFGQLYNGDYLLL